MKVILNAAEMDLLSQQDPDTADDGGFQGLLVGLQRKCDRPTGELLLSENDVKRIGKYAFEYKNGGWQDRLLAIFERSLGSKLGRE